VFASITLEAGMKRREVLGGTGPESVAKALEAARGRLAPDAQG
jgi:hypothetical protein